MKLDELAWMPWGSRSTFADAVWEYAHLPNGWRIFRPGERYAEYVVRDPRIADLAGPGHYAISRSPADWQMNLEPLVAQCLVYAAFEQEPVS